MEPVDLGIPGLTDARLLGRGGFGTVYAATEPEFGRSVAVKVLRDRLDDESARRSFVRECRAMGVLSGHPHIVTVHRGGTTGTGTSYIVMELMTGGSLADRGRVPWPELLDIGVLLAGALETAHRHGVLHLDLKPANVLVSRYGEPKLGDFGISRLPGVAETSGAVRASPAYAAPERLADGTASVATDLYGFGATLFSLLTGAPAFQDGSGDLIAVLARIVRLPLPDLRGDGVPDPVCRVLETLMAKSPGERYATAEQAAAALQDAQRATGQPVARAVVEGAPSPTQEAAAATGVTLRRVTTGEPRGPVAAPLPSGVPVAAPAPTWPGADVTMVPGRGRPVTGHPSWPPPPGGAPGSGPAARAGRPPSPPAGAATAHATGPAPRRGRVLPAVAAVLVVAAVAGGVLAALRPWAATPAPTTTTTTTTTSATTTTVPPEPAPAPQAVTLAPGVTGAAAEPVRAVLDAYVTAIDDARYEDAFALFSPDSATARDGLDAWLDAQQPRAITDATLLSVSEEGPGTAQAVLTFRSRQDPGDSPDGRQDCLDWELAYTLDGPDRLIRSSSTVTDPQPC